MIRALALALALSIALSGCAARARRDTLPVLAIDLSHGEPLPAFERLVRITRALGYHVDFADARYGVLGTHTRSTLPRHAGPATVVVQCYADGRATLTVLGGTPVGDRVRVPSTMRREVVALARALENGDAP